MNTMTIMEAAWAMAEQPRAEAHEHVNFLAWQLRIAQNNIEVPLLAEQDQADVAIDVVGALHQLFAKGEPVYRPATELTKRHRGNGEITEAFMLADIVAAGIASAHETTEGEVITQSDQDSLVGALVDFRIRDRRQAMAPPQHLVA